MYCLRCGTKVEDNVEYCPHCGSNIKEELARYDYKPIEDPQKKTAVNLEPSHEEQFQYSIKYSFGNEEELIKEYVGKNYEKIKNSKFSWPTFFLGPLYFLYRKLYIYAIIWTLIILIFGILSPALTFFIQIGLSIAFPKLYLDKAKRKVIEIQKFNKNLSKEDIIKLCRKTGKVNIILPALIITSIVGMISLIITVVIEEIKQEEIITNQTQTKIDSLEYKIPEGFKAENYNTDNYKSYTYKKDYNYCRISFSTINKYVYENNEQYLKVGLTEKEKAIPTDIKTINGKNWLHLNIVDNYFKEDYYVLEDNSKYYKLNTYDNNTTDVCKQQFSELLNSISYKE